MSIDTIHIYIYIYIYRVILHITFRKIKLIVCDKVTEEFRIWYYLKGKLHCTFFSPSLSPNKVSSVSVVARPYDRWPDFDSQHGQRFSTLSLRPERKVKRVPTPDVKRQGVNFAIYLHIQPRIGMRRITPLLSSISSQHRDLLSTERFSDLPNFRLTPSNVFGCLLTQYVFNEAHIFLLNIHLKMGSTYVT